MHDQQNQNDGSGAPHATAAMGATAAAASTAAAVANGAPWYRHPWTWGLMAGPAIVLVAGIATTVIAIRSDDGLVARDYYKRGLMINKVLSKEGRPATQRAVAACIDPPDGGGAKCRNG